MMANDHYRYAFPDFDYELPEIPGMRDDSWKNDVCPHMVSADGSLNLWCDYADPVQRENEGAKRYTLCRTDEDGMDAEILAESDDFAEVMAVLEHVMAKGGAI